MSQWFYFKVSNTREGSSYKFNIINLIKPDSLYAHGMRPLLYSKQEARSSQIGWRRACHDIKYFQSKKKTSITLYTLSFTVELNYS
jgi:cytosolic carboxypeptidase protein 2/3